MSAVQTGCARAVFESALEQAPATRLDYVERLCAGEPELLAHVEQLLSADQAAEACEFLRAPAITPKQFAVTDDRLRSERSKRLEIGGYRLLGKISEGGTSTVFLAEGQAGQPAEVAIKLLRSGLSRRLAWRSSTEGAAMAGVEHPCIPRILDSGSTAEGEPFFVLEFVDGEPVTEYCDRERLTIRQRLELAIEIGDTVACVHRHLIVHRDLKPSNILVDTDGQPRLLDFGIAKFLAGSGGQEVTTATADRALTPNYAAPEQFFGGEITTATDVYSLGVLLYELLTGVRPYSWGGVPLEAMLETWPLDRFVPPSQRFDRRAVVSEPQLSSTRAELRGATTGRLERRLEGDIDTVVSKALRFESDQRYSSVAELVADLERIVEGRPIRARPATLPYRFGKFVRRKPLVVVQVVAAALLAGFFSLNAIFESKRFQRERDRADQQRRLAEEEQLKSAAVTDLLLEAYRIADPYRGRGVSVSAKEILAKGADLSRQSMADSPETLAEVEHTLGRLNLNLGFFEEAESHLRRALELGEASAGAGSVATARYRSSVADVLSRQNDFEPAEKEARTALEVMEQSGADFDPQVVASHRRLLGRILLERGQFDEAHRLVTAALATHREFEPAASSAVDQSVESEIALDLNVLLEVQLWRGEFDQALTTGREAVELSRRAFPPGSAAIAESLSGRAIAAWNLRDFEAAMDGMEEAMALALDSLGEWHPSVASISNNLGLFHLSQGNVEAAEPLLRRAMEVFTSIYDRPHADLLRCQSNLARILMQRKEADEAVALLSSSVAGYRILFGSDHPLVAEALQHLGSTYYIDGQLELAREHLALALEIRQRTAADDHTTQGANRILLARVLRESGDSVEARDHLVEALRAFSQLEGEIGVWLVAIGNMRLAEVLLDLENFDQAEELIRLAIGSFSSVDDVGHQAKYFESRGILGRVLAARGSDTAAESELLASWQLLRDAAWTSAEQQAEAARRLVEFYESRGRMAEAAEFRAASVRGKTSS